MQHNILCLLQPDDIDAKLHDVRCQSAESTHDEQHVLAVRQWHESDGHDRGYDCWAQSGCLPPAAGQRLLVRGCETAELRAPTPGLRCQAHV